VEIKDSMKSVAKATVSIMTVKKSCDTDKWACTDNALRIISAFADLSTYLMGAVGHCSRIKFEAGIACAAQIDSLIAELADVARASGRINKLCQPHPPAPSSCSTFDSDDCKSEYNNAVANNNLPAFFARCHTEGGEKPLRSRCSLCCERPSPPAPTIPVPTPVPAPTIPVPTPVPAPTIPVPTPVPAPRLYAAGRASAEGAAPQAVGMPTLALAALLPVSAVVGFLGRSLARFAGRRGSP